MERKVLLVVLVLGFSLALSCSAVPTTRSFKFDEQNTSSVLQLHVQEVEVTGEIERRMDIESADYPGTGANNHHDPKTPGKA